MCFLKKLVQKSYTLLKSFLKTNFGKYSLISSIEVIVNEEVTLRLENWFSLRENLIKQNFVNVLLILIFQ